MGKWSDSQKRYYASERGKAARRKYQTSVKGRETHNAYRARLKAKLSGDKQTKIITENTPVTIPAVIMNKKK